jgi:hypothetical protein
MREFMKVPPGIKWEQFQKELLAQGQFQSIRATVNPEKI